MDKEYNSNIFRTYKLDYLGKYHFYEKDEFLNSREDGEVSCLLYATLNDGEDFINALTKIKKNQVKL